MNYTIFIQQLDKIIAEFNGMRLKSQHNDLSDFPKVDRQSLVTRSIASINRIAGENSTYVKEISRIINRDPDLHKHTSGIIGIVKALRDDMDSGYLQNLAEIVHADIFSDFLEMANYLVDNGYKDPAAVIAGSTLESHLRNLATKNSIPIDNAGKPLTADRLNADIAKARIYSNLDSKNVTAWLDLRNKAAHGKYSEYTSAQVELLISSVRDFITRNPA